MMRRVFRSGSVLSSSSIAICGLASQESFSQIRGKYDYRQHMKHNKNHHNKQNHKNLHYNGPRLSEFKLLNTAPRKDDHAEGYFKNTGQSLNVLLVRDQSGSGWMGTLSFAMPDGSTQKAFGVSNRKAESQQLCIAHAGQLIDFYSPGGLYSRDKNAPRPRPLKMITNQDKNQKIVKPAAPTNQDPKLWQQYVTDCAAYIESVERTTVHDTLSRGEVPLTGDHIIDASIVSAFEATLDETAIPRLEKWWRAHRYSSQLLPSNWTKELRRNMGKRLFAMTFTMPIYPHNAFTVSGTKDNVPVRMAMVALRALKLSQKHIDPSVHTKSAGAVVSGGSGGGVTKAGDNSNASPATDYDKLINSISQELKDMPQHTPNERERLLQLYTSCMGFPEIEPQFDFDAVSNMYVCQLDVGELTCGGMGINRSEATHAAKLAAYEELYKLDAEFREFGRILDKHKRLDPSQIVRLDLPKDLGERVAQLTKDVVLDDDQQQQDGFEGEGYDRQGEVFHKRLNRTALEASVYRSTAMQTDLRELHSTPTYQQKFAHRRGTLAMHRSKEELLEIIANNQVTVLCGTTGCGKTTQVPQYILDDAINRGEGSDCSIVITQPRRISAISIAQRIAAERLQKVGADVGYTIRLDAKPGAHINLLTTGVLLRIMSGSPDLRHIKYLILDEIHERDINCDFLMILVKRLLQVNKDIKIILMSATLASDKFSAYFGDAPVLNVDGMTYPVDVKHLAEIADITKKYGQLPMMPGNNPALRSRFGGASKFNQQQQQRNPILTAPQPDKNPDYATIATLVRHAADTGLTDKNSILIFLPGWMEIKKTGEAIARLPGASRYHVIKLHSSVKQEDQMAAFNPPPPGKVKVVLATNIAESGITIDDVGVVIDTGSIKETHWILSKGTTEVGQNTYKSTTHLQLRWCSRANSTQRTGRAGRTQKGTCYRLYTKEQHASFSDFQVPEMLREPLDSIILRAMAMGHRDPEQLLREGVDVPPTKSLIASMDILKGLGAIDGKTQQLTTLGKWLALLPTSPSLSKMIILGAMMRCLDPVLTIAATEELTPFVMSRETEREMLQSYKMFAGETGSDQLTKLNAYNGYVAKQGSARFAQERWLNPMALSSIGRYKSQYFETLHKSGFLPDAHTSRSVSSTFNSLFMDTSTYSHHSSNIALVKACICAGLFPNVALGLTQEKKNNNKNELRNLRLKMTDKIALNSKSAVGAMLGKPDVSKIIVYDDIFKVKEDRVNNATVVSIWGILLFGAAPELIEHKKNLGLGVIDEWIMFKSSPETIQGILKLKKLLDECIWRKLRYPRDKDVNVQLQYLQHVCREIVSLPVETESTRLKSDGTREKVLWKDAGELLYAKPGSPVENKRVQWSDDGDYSVEGEDDDDEMF